MGHCILLVMCLSTINQTKRIGRGRYRIYRKKWNIRCLWIRIRRGLGCMRGVTNRRIWQDRCLNKTASKVSSIQNTPMKTPELPAQATKTPADGTPKTTLTSANASSLNSKCENQSDETPTQSRTIMTSSLKLAIMTAMTLFPCSESGKFHVPTGLSPLFSKKS